MKNPSTILITGASSGIGEALALAYAKAGVTLILTGRNIDRLETVADQCRTLGARVDTLCLDVTDRAGMEKHLDQIFEATPLDLVIANAGIAGSDGEDIGRATRRILDVNINGVVNTVLPSLDHMRQRGSGQIAIVSSIAGFRGLPSAPAYCASKAAVKAWGEGLRSRYERDGVQVSVICPGFVKSRMTDKNEFRMPFLMTAEKAAGIIRRGLARNKGRIVFPLPMHIAVWLMTVLPSPLIDRFARRIPDKE